MDRENGENSPLPLTFPPNSSTFVYVQKEDGEIYHGRLNYQNRRIPRWTNNVEKGDDSPDRVFVTMSNHDTLTANLERFRQDLNIGYEIPEECRCFIMNGTGILLVARLHPHNRLQDIDSPIRVMVRMTYGNNTRFVGGFKHLRGPRPMWLPVRTES